MSDIHELSEFVGYKKAAEYVAEEERMLAAAAEDEVREMEIEKQYETRSK